MPNRTKTAITAAPLKPIEKKSAASRLREPPVQSYWAATRARLDSQELAREIGPLTIPPASDATTEQQPATNSAR